MVKHVAPFYEMPSLNCSRIVNELIASGALPVNAYEYADRVFEGKQGEYHIAAGKCIWEHSRTLLAFLTKSGLTYARATLFVSKPGRITLWHKDGDGIDCALNIPWFNASSTWTQWYLGEQLEDKVQFNTDGSEYCIAGSGAVVQATHQMKLDKATLINVGEFHRINSVQARNYRGIISIRFNDKPSYKDVINMLES